MNNFEQKTTKYRVLEEINDLKISNAIKKDLINVINIYYWLSSNDILIDATFKDVIELFLEENGIYFDDDIEAFLESLD